MSNLLGSGFQHAQLPPVIRCLAHPAEIGGVGQLSSNVHEAKYCNLHWVNVTGILDDPDEYNWNAKLLGIYINIYYIYAI